MKSSFLFVAISGLILSLSGNSEEARYPLKVIDRPSVMPTKIIGISLNTSYKHEDKSVNADINTDFGLANHLQGSFSWDGFAINTRDAQFDVKRTVNLGLKYNYLSCVPHVSLSATLRVPFHIWSGEILRDMTIGLPTVFYNDLMAGGLLGDLFTLTMRDKVAMKFDFKWWYGIQVYGNLWAAIDSSFGSVELKNLNNKGDLVTKAFWQELPLNLELVYAFNHYFDLGVNFGFSDALKAKDTFKAGLTFTARAGKLFG